MIIATASLTVQIVVLFLLFYGYWQKKKLLFKRHARVMTAAVALHLVLIFAIMIPAFVLAVFPIFVVPHVFEQTSVVSLVHLVFGSTAIAIGVWLDLSWLTQDITKCFSRKKFMLPTLAIWSATLIFGIALYSILYWQALMG